jgi:hypothetical protein
MKFKTIIVTTLASLTIATAAQAQLGLTEKECDAKYGDGKFGKCTFYDGNYNYKVGDLILSVKDVPTGFNEPIVSIRYYKPIKGGGIAKMPSATIAKLLKQNALGYIWFDYGDGGDGDGEKFWSAFASKEAQIGNAIDGGQIVADLDESGCYLTITRNAHVSGEVPTNGVYVNDKASDTRSDAEKEFDAKLHGQ